MVILTLITQVFILIKNAIVASYFGISAELDAFNLANRITTFIYSFIGAGVSTVIIPYLREKVNKRGIDIFISVIYTAGFLLLLAIIIFRVDIILLAGGSKEESFLSIAANILIFTAITGFLESLIQLAKGILEFNEKFNIQKLIVLSSNVIIVIMLFIGRNNIYYYALIVLFAAIINLFFHIIFLKKSNFNYELNYDLKDQNFREMLRLFYPTMLSTGVYQLSLLIDTLIAARLPVGSISTLSYANAVISMINLLLLGNIISFVYPKLVKKNNNKDRQNSLISYILLVNVMMCLLIVLFYSSGREGIRVLFERGEFTSGDTEIVFIVALILTLSLPANAIRDLLYRYFYMNKDTITPFINSIMVSIVNIVISLFLAKYIGLYGIVIGTILASFYSLFFISFRFGRKFPVYFSKKILFIENSKVIIITILAVIAAMLFKNMVNITNPYAGLIVYSVYTIVVFIVLLKTFKSKIFKINL